MGSKCCKKEKVSIRDLTTKVEFLSNRNTQVNSMRGGIQTERNIIKTVYAKVTTKGGLDMVDGVNTRRVINVVIECIYFEGLSTSCMAKIGNDIIKIDTIENIDLKKKKYIIRGVLSESKA